MLELGCEMERKIVCFIAASLDGYVARSDHSLDWLEKVEGEGDNGYASFYETVDTIIMGRITYEQVMVLTNGEFPYKNKQCYVFSKTQRKNTEFVTFINEDISTFITKLKSEPGAAIWLVGGGELVQSFLQEKLLDEIILTLAPAIIGSGIPLFTNIEKEVELTLIESVRYNQFIQLHYAVKK